MIVGGTEGVQAVGDGMVVLGALNQSNEEVVVGLMAMHT